MKTIYLTVDTECHDWEKVNLYIYGRKNGEDWGIKKILELAKKQGIPVNFFVDVGECRKYGDSFIEQMVALIHSYGQPVYFHLHPDYLSNDHTRTYLWEYSYEEKQKIISLALAEYRRFAMSQDKIIFRAGRYGVDNDVYEILSRQNIEILDLSYVYGARKMCHISEEDLHVKNCSTRYKEINILPNTRFIAFDYFGKKKCVGLDSADATFNEFKRFIQRTSLNNIVWTMHSWNFIRKWFFIPKYFQGDKAMVRKFQKSVKLAKQAGFSFGDLSDYVYKQEDDELLNLCEGFKGKMLGLFNNFVRFQKIARLNKKYFMIYFLAYLICFVALLVVSLNIIL